MSIKQLRKLFRWLGISSLICALLYAFTHISAFRVLTLLILGVTGLLIWLFWKCPHCGKGLRYSANGYCPYCGGKLDE